jgi:hypothetical protein
MLTQVLTKSGWEMVKVCLSIILALLLCLLHVILFFLNNCCMSLLSAKIFCLSVNLLMITMYILSFTLPFLSSRTVEPGQSFTEVHLRTAFISCCLFPLLLHLHTLLLVKGLPLINGTNKRLGHPALRTVKHVISKFSLPAFSNKPNASCVSCQQAKAHQLPFSASTSVSNLPLEFIFSDVWGPSPIVSSNGNKYYVSFVDDFSRFTWLFSIQCKSNVFSVFLQFQSMVELLFTTKIKQIQTDWGGEFRPLNTFFHKHGIIYRISCPHTHQQQGCVERKHRHIIDTSLTLLAGSHVPKTFWDEACQTSCYLINRLLTPVLQNLSPFQKLFNRRRLQFFKNFRLCLFS